MQDLFEQLPNTIATLQEKLLRELYKKVQEQEQRIKDLENDVYMLQRYMYNQDEY